LCAQYSHPIQQLRELSDLPPLQQEVVLQEVVLQEVVLQEVVLQEVVLQEVVLRAEPS